MAKMLPKLDPGRLGSAGRWETGLPGQPRRQRHPVAQQAPSAGGAAQTGRRVEAVGRRWRPPEAAAGWRLQVRRRTLMRRQRSGGPVDLTVRVSTYS